MMTSRKNPAGHFRLIIVSALVVGGCLTGLGRMATSSFVQAQQPTLTPTVIEMTAVYPPLPPTATSTRIPDDTPPVMTLFITGEQTMSGWYQSPISLTFVIFDDWSGVDKSRYKFEGEAKWHYTENGFPPVVITRTGTYTVIYYSRDRNYNVETPPHTYKFVVLDENASQLYLPVILKSF